MTNKNVRLEQAVDWIVRRNSPDFHDWAELTEWLEIDPANAQLFARLSVVDAEVADCLTGAVPEVQPQPDIAPMLPGVSARIRWGRRIALAAALVAATFALFIIRPNDFLKPRYETITTASGTRQEVVIDNATQITLNGATRFAIARADQRKARLVYGEASFKIAHDPLRPFELMVGDARVVDIGTRFDVFFDGQETEIKLAEGQVEYSANGTVVRLGAGQMLRTGHGEMQISSVDRATVGSWTEGRLVYRGDPLAVVAADLQRNVGVPVGVESKIAAKPVTAVIQLSPKRGEMPPHLESLLGVKLVRQGKGWLLKSAK